MTTRCVSKGALVLLLSQTLCCLALSIHVWYAQPALIRQYFSNVTQRTQVDVANSVSGLRVVLQNLQVEAFPLWQ